MVGETVAALSPVASVKVYGAHPSYDLAMLPACEFPSGVWQAKVAVLDQKDLDFIQESMFLR